MNLAAGRHGPCRGHGRTALRYSRRPLPREGANSAIREPREGLARARGGGGEHRRSPPRDGIRTRARHEAMNVLLVTTDQQRADTIGAYGSRLAATPNLDRLAAAGVRFDACRTQNPYCQPSRATILTGRYPSRHGVCSNGVDSTAPSTRASARIAGTTRPTREPGASCSRSSPRSRTLRPVTCPTRARSRDGACRHGRRAVDGVP